MLIVALEGIGNVSPQALQCYNLRINLSIGHGMERRSAAGESLHLYPSTVPVVVENDVETVLHAVVNNLLNACQPCGVNPRRSLSAAADVSAYP